MEYYSESVERLIYVLLQLKTKEEAYRFLSDICTAKELKDMTQRLDISILLEQDLNYREISEAVGISPATISRVSRSFYYGNGGLSLAVERLKNRK